MQTAAEVRRVLSSKPNSIKIDQFRLKFQKPEAIEQMSPEEKAAISKAVWKARLGVGRQFKSLRPHERKLGEAPPPNPHKKK